MNNTTADRPPPVWALDGFLMLQLYARFAYSLLFGTTHRLGSADEAVVQVMANEAR
ncbi:hypothetical protein GCM10007198_03530 [Microbacterium aerolatum]|uniref:Uncharacterized protein n=1 Tax=Microbacterium aerolatum TaxID=153731 RepID=A0A511AFQ6_9MICO|nr:hypothetical protein MAE01_13990 [Microbacterium aerolatum]GGB16251.1 hypothetical protein GCM10007198_03530 [Microbacterium aerolatum]